MYNAVLSTTLFLLVISLTNSLTIQKNELQYKEKYQRKNVLPKSFTECVDAIRHPSMPILLVERIQNHCLDGFISVDHTHNWVKNFTIDEQNYIKSIFRKIIQEAGGKDAKHGRKKRSVPMFGGRIRREMRAAPYTAWHDYARNVMRLKYDVVRSPHGKERNKYDIIADIHVQAIQSAHFGPNFLPWHRLYVIVMESALGVPIPYWDSRLDYEMEDPSQSIIWTAKYFGNGFGIVKTGPFANFDTPIGPLFRNVGSDGCLFRYDGVQNILKQKWLRDISEPTASEKSSLEGEHNSVHNWVDGQMNNIEASPHDPVFFNHHSFVDFIWEEFRQNQMKCGIDPVKDLVTPPSNTTFQNITDPSVGLSGYYNEDGYSMAIASMIKFIPTPTCPFCSHSPDLYCDKMKGVCVSQIRNPFEYYGNQEEIMPAARECGINSGGSRSHPFPFYERDERARMDSVTMNYNRNSNGNRQTNSNRNNRGMFNNGGTGSSHNWMDMMSQGTRTQGPANNQMSDWDSWSSQNIFNNQIPTAEGPSPLSYNPLPFSPLLGNIIPPVVNNPQLSGGANPFINSQVANFRGQIDLRYPPIIGMQQHAMRSLTY